jgi:hypothetical protein
MNLKSFTYCTSLSSEKEHELIDKSLVIEIQYSNCIANDTGRAECTIEKEATGQKKKKKKKKRKI